MKRIILFSFLVAFCTLFLLSGCKSGMPYNLDINETYPIVPADNSDKMLTIGGKTASGETYQLEIADLENALPLFTFTCVDPWRKEETEYTGFALYQLLNSIGLAEDAEFAVISADNDYQVQVPLERLQKYYYQLTIREGGAYFRDLPDDLNKGNFAVAIDFATFTDLSVDKYKMDEVWWISEIYIQ